MECTFFIPGVIRKKEKNFPGFHVMIHKNMIYCSGNLPILSCMDEKGMLFL